MKRTVLLFATLLVVALLLPATGCGGTDDAVTSTSATATSISATAVPGDTSAGRSSGGTSPTQGPPSTAAPSTEAEQSTSTTEAASSSWVVSIADDDSFTQGDITYSITLDLTATNPSPNIKGLYTGSAAAQTTVDGTMNGEPLNATSAVNSTKLEFTLEDALAGGALAPLDPNLQDKAMYSGTGTIVMEAAGSGTIGPAGGGFSNTSGQEIKVEVIESAVTLSVTIEGHTYTFQGTIGRQ